VSNLEFEGTGVRGAEMCVISELGTQRVSIYEMTGEVRRRRDE
jgi:hypothetical protein